MTGKNGAIPDPEVDALAINLGLLGYLGKSTSVTKLRILLHFGQATVRKYLCLQLEQIVAKTLQNDRRASSRAEYWDSKLGQGGKRLCRCPRASR